MQPRSTAPPADDDLAGRASRVIRRGRWPLLALWLVALVVAGMGAMNVAKVLSGGGWYPPGTESTTALHQLQHGFVARGETTATLVIHDKRYKDDDPRFEQRVRRVAVAVRDDHDLKVSDMLGWTTVQPGDRAPYTGNDHRTVIAAMAMNLEDGVARRELPHIQQDLYDRYSGQGLEVSLVGEASFWGETNVLSQQSLAKAEMITLPLIILILLLLFRSVTASLVALTVGVSAIVFTLGVIEPYAQHHDLSIFAQNTATMLGLGVGVDYSLFMITRFREQLAKGDSVEAAVAATLRRAGHTVIASGVTVLLAMCTLFLIDLNVIFSIAVGAVLVVAFSVLTAIFFLPVLLHMVGHRINAGRVRLPKGLRERLQGRGGNAAGEEASRWYRLALRVMARPVVFLVVGAVALLALAVPATWLRTFSPDARILPQSSPVRVGYEHVRDTFGIGTTSPIQAVITTPKPLDKLDGTGSLVDFSTRLEHLPHVAGVQSPLPVLKAAAPQAPFTALTGPAMDRLPRDAQDTVRHYVADGNRRIVFEVIPNVNASSDEARSLLDRVHDEAARLPSSYNVAVGGETAVGTDGDDRIQSGLPSVVMVMLAAGYLVLLLTFRSLLLPLKAIAMNLLSIAATYGILVLVFQDGIGTGLLHFEHTNYLQNFVPVVLLTLLFSLSTDYEVFLLDRVREEYTRTGDNTASVARGLTRTAPLISGAALLMVAVFGSFGFAGIVPIQQLGFGLAAAVLLDATVVRLIVVPATMRLMGRWNWWLPGRRTPQPAAAPGRTDTSSEPLDPVGQ
ncbi:MMPL family transporter [Streptomyces sp. NPDC005728]|uniref:MMPL family transporter n=1 Tax=Streptomyces sp. NPDC005728 TaxID=3157054 RepID=UPI0033DA8A45